MSSNFHVRIKQEEVVEDFKNYIIERYGSLHSNMGPEVARGLIMVLEAENYGKYGNSKLDEVPEKISETHTHTKLTPTKERFLREFEKAFNDVDLIKPRVLEDFIIKVEGVTDDRPIDNRIRLLKSINWIKWEDRKWKVFHLPGGVDELLYGPISEDIYEDK